jgi:hypothetical protein
MSKYALVVMSESGEAHPGGQGRMLHALQAAAEFRSAGVEASLWFHGIGVEWLTVFEARSDRFGEVYGPLFDSLRDVVGGACEFCAVKRFKVEASATALGVPIVGGANEHHTIAHLVADGYEVVVF